MAHCWMSGRTMEMLSVRLVLCAGGAVLYANGMRSVLYPASSVVDGLTQQADRVYLGNYLTDTSY